MNKEQAISLLINVAKLAQSRGVLTLEDAQAVLFAIRLLETKEDIKEGKENKEKK